MFCACTDRERSNPLDPKNPDTQGKPTGLRVYSIQDTVFLQWDAINLDDLIGYQLYRRRSDESDFSPLILLSRSLTSFKDFDVEFNIRYEYQLTALGRNYESAPSPPQRITPGPTLSWAVNNLSGQLIKLSHDAQHQIFRVSGFFTLVDVEPNPNSGEVWVVERLSRFIGNAVRVSASGRVREPIVPFVGPVDAAIHFDSNAVWVADREDGVVAKLDSLGGRLFAIQDFAAPTALDVDQRSGACWVADAASRRVARIPADGSAFALAPAPFFSLQSLVVNSRDGSVWVADSSRVVKLAEDGSHELTLAYNFEFASKVSVNENTGEVWVIDFRPSRVLKFSENGDLLFELGGFLAPRDLAANPFDNGCVVADTDNNRLVKIDASGAIEGVFENIGLPDAVSVQYLAPK